MSAKGDIQGLLELLKSKDIKTQLQAMNALTGLWSNEVCKDLEMLLLSGEKKIRSRAASILDYHGWQPENDVQILLYALASNDLRGLVGVPVRNTINMIVDFYEQYHNIISYTYVNYTIPYILAFANTRKAECENEFRACLADKTGLALTRIILATIVGVMRNDRSVDVLGSIIRDTTDLLHVRYAAVFGLQLSGIVGLDTAVDLLYDSDLDGEFKISGITQVLGYMGACIIDKVVSALDCRNFHTRNTAILSLAGTGDINAINHLKETRPSFNADDLNTVDAIIVNFESLSSLSSKSLLKSLKGSKLISIRMISAIALGNISDPQTIDSLYIAALKDKDTYVRLESWLALGKMLPNPRVKRLLLNALKSDTYEKRMSAVVVLMEHGESVLTYMGEIDSSSL